MHNWQAAKLNVVLTFFAVVAWAAGKGTAPPSYTPPNEELTNPYETPQLWQPPAGTTFSASPGIFVGPDDGIWVFNRCRGSCEDSDVNPVIEFDQSGKVLKSFGARMFSHPHGLYVDKERNIWVTEQPGKVKGQQVFKLSPEGKILMTLGRAATAEDDPEVITQPNSVVVARNGDIFIGDGHSPTCGASRILKFSKDGKFIKQFGQKGNAPGDIMCPHSLAIDSQGRLFVADMGNKRVDIFDQSGQFITSWRQFGRPTGLFIDTHDMLYVADTASNDLHEPLMKGAPLDYTYNPGCKRGIRIGSAKDGKVIAFIPDPQPVGQTSMGEGVAVDHEGNIYQTPDPYNLHIKKYIKKL